jgi:hypothetical protein
LCAFRGPDEEVSQGSGGSEQSNKTSEKKVEMLNGNDALECRANCDSGGHGHAA